MKLWAGRFSKEIDQKTNDFNSSIAFDCRMAQEDIAGSMAHAAMLEQQGILSPEDGTAIREGLAAIAAALASYFLLHSTLLRLIAATVLGIGAGLVLPSLNTLITSAAGAGERGLVTCLYGTVRFFGVAIGPPVFGLSDRLGASTLFLSTAGLAALAAFLAWTLIKVQQVLPPEMAGKTNTRQ